jgi:hypothetical protein
MALTKLTTDLSNIQALDDEPNDVTGLTATQVKVIFDKAGNDIKTYINNTLTAEIDVLPATSISVDTIPTLAGTEVQTVLESVKARIDTIAVSNVNAEVANSHTGADARTYASLSDRFDTMDILDTTKANQVDLTATNLVNVAQSTLITNLDNTTYKKGDWTGGTNWCKYPNGQIHQWGSITTPNSSVTTLNGMFYNATLFNFPIPFITGVLSLNSWQTQNVNIWCSVNGGTTKTASSIYVLGNDATAIRNRQFFWYAIGF